MEATSSKNKSENQLTSCFCSCRQPFRKKICEVGVRIHRIRLAVFP